MVLRPTGGPDPLASNTAAVRRLPAAAVLRTDGRFQIQISISIGQGWGPERPFRRAVAAVAGPQPWPIEIEIWI